MSRQGLATTTKRGTTGAITTKSAGNGPLSIAMCIVACFLCTSVVLYYKLEGVHAVGSAMEDDLIAGGGDGRVHQLLHLRQKLKPKKQRKKQIAGVDPTTGQGRQIFAFEQHMRNQAKARRQQGILSPREQFEQKYNPDSDHYDADIRNLVNAMRAEHAPNTPPALPYDVYRCPDEPPPNYPFTWNLVDDVLPHWNPDVVQVPKDYIHSGLCVFDWDLPDDRKRAEHYRQASVPFVVHRYPDVWETAARWSSEEFMPAGNYLQQLVGDESVRNEHSLNNHFMYWKVRGRASAGFTPPTDMMQQSFADWFRHAQQLQDNLDHQRGADQTKQEHWYFRLNGMYENHAYLYDELPFFDPSYGTTFTMVEPELHRGINCRFGMAGVMAEAHFDAHNNFIALLGGQRRYILAHPNQCEQMELYPPDHPSGRHSKVNWSTAAQEFGKASGSTRPFTKAQVNEVVLQAGDLMYLPPYWFHFIVSLDINYQCNSRSGEGESSEYVNDIDACGFARGAMPKAEQRHLERR